MTGTPPAPPMLTIGRLAAHAGVTVRAIRHYHRRGLLAEPDRDASGYRRYDAAAVIALIRIRTLTEAGVPLARIDQLMRADAEEFARAVTEIDAALEARIGQLTEHRRRIAELADGERLFLPADVIAVLDELRAIGVSERGVQIERDAWLLMAALGPDLVSGWAAEKSAALEDPEFRRVYLACDEIIDLDPDDARLGEVADIAVAWASRRAPATGTPPDPTATLTAATLVNAHIARASPAMQRVFELAEKRAGSASTQRVEPAVPRGPRLRT
jgi:DNA-binding transcriptional MerR regulator